MTKGALTVFNILQSGEPISYSCGTGEEFGQLKVQPVDGTLFEMKVHHQDFDTAKRLSELGDYLSFEELGKLWYDRAFFRGYVPLRDYVKKNYKGKTLDEKALYKFLRGLTVREEGSSKGPTKIKDISLVGPNYDILWINLGQSSVSIDRLRVLIPDGTQTKTSNNSITTKKRKK